VCFSNSCSGLRLWIPAIGEPTEGNDSQELFRFHRVLRYSTSFLTVRVSLAGPSNVRAQRVDLKMLSGFVYPVKLFGFPPESLSPSPRNAFHVHPGIVFTLPRNPQPVASKLKKASFLIHSGPQVLQPVTGFRYRVHV
jgi:hypothetical protein